MGGWRKRYDCFAGEETAEEIEELAEEALASPALSRRYSPVVAEYR